MKPSLIPHSFSDRLSVSMAFAVLAVSLFEFADNSPLWGVGFLCMCLAFLANAYVVQDPPQLTIRSDSYAQYIKRLQEVTARLREVADFLGEEQAHMLSSERAFAALQKEHAALEPIVRTERQTVEEVLRAHHAFASRSVWKERFVGFAIGVLASLIASFIYARLPWQ